jgi:ankyrin repeat protein
MARPGRPRNHEPIADDIDRAIRQGDFPMLKSLVTTATVNITDGEARTPLFVAIIENKSDVIKWLIDQGADINHQDRNGWTPLHFAVQGKQADAIALLLSRGADANLHDVYGNGPLWRAAFDSRGSYGLVETLIEAGADSNHKNKSDKSPIDFAVTIGDEKLKAILTRGSV